MLGLFPVIGEPKTNGAAGEVRREELVVLYLQKSCTHETLLVKLIYHWSAETETSSC